MIGDVPTALLSAEQHEALESGVAVVLDRSFDDLSSLASGGVCGNQYGRPPAGKVLARVHEGFARTFLVSVVTVARKLVQPGSWPLGCVAEELALEAIIDHAEAVLMADGSNADLAEFRELAS